MKTKRIICIVLATVMMSVLAVNTFAIAVVTASTSASAKQGDEVAVSVSITDLSGIVSGTVKVSYNTSELKYVKSRYDSSVVSTPRSSGGTVTFSINNSSGGNLSGTLATITFTTLADEYTQCYISVEISDAVDAPENPSQ
ncbi:MAG: cohesin domain-containing protein [Oscillospiraceae bacterium]|nr:cohesin domain-containing protein [Oscillospiraceae bacterium]